MGRQALLVEDDNAIATVIVAGLEAEGFAVAVRDSVAGRDQALSESAYDVMLTDVMLADGDGIDTLTQVRSAFPEMPIIILSAQNTLDTAVRATDGGAFEYFPKPFDLDEVVRAARQAAETRRSAALDSDEQQTGLPLIGRSQPMQDVYRLITRVLNNNLTVLVLGESGTGKELVAEAIHDLGNRKSGPFVPVNTAAIPRELIESELFGHEKGAFTGATARNIGKFEEANGGTLFLDEIGDMPAEAQTRLLRALQSGRIRRVGGNEEIDVDVRIVAATNRDLVPLISSGAFREDLYYRLNVVPIKLPPLRERRDDVEALARHFLQKAAQDGLPRRTLSKDAARLLEQQSWRGNVRELQNLVYRAALLARNDTIDAETIVGVLDDSASDSEPFHGAGQGNIAGIVAQWLETHSFRDGELYHAALGELEKPVFRYALERTAGNQLKAAQLLGINRNTLRKRLLELEIDPEEFTPG
ncbi:chemotaxis protein CheY [Aurantiacibacter atlanticus]|uniref:DNA-binding transcriptional regulator NtrC n=1 Tax=Aurantiacibacter atlanticus TaxID=1648404 RepID=A0A0H4VHG0_9SPHN|nr:sigma-54 dependent transcriptional regulator [Aurantiacibacter atlanticus]AKQ42306.1 chemotaxis protein CheY [Aurantiacibacter atlanticus]MDF1835036.1 sigma-54 dependent transcriptional regulator [Alteraurantiacibacter sp. bin_em_oilr2.035]